jgi:hypothetical protein
MDNNHAASLEARHADLDRQLSEEGRKPSPDTGRIAQLKKQKLRIKDALTLH